MFSLSCLFVLRHNFFLRVICAGSAPWSTATSSEADDLRTSAGASGTSRTLSSTPTMPNPSAISRTIRKRERQARQGEGQVSASLHRSSSFLLLQDLSTLAPCLPPLLIAHAIRHPSTSLSSIHFHTSLPLSSTQRQSQTQTPFRVHVESYYEWTIDQRSPQPIPLTVHISTLKSTSNLSGCLERKFSRSTPVTRAPPTSPLVLHHRRGD